MLMVMVLSWPLTAPSSSDRFMKHVSRARRITMAHRDARKRAYDYRYTLHRIRDTAGNYLMASRAAATASAGVL